MMTWDKSSTNVASAGGVTAQDLCTRLVEEMGGTYASALGINLASMEPAEIFKWFLASLLIGAGVSDRVALRTYKEFERADALSVEAVLATGWRRLTAILNRSGYARRASNTATRLVGAASTLKEEYDGDLNRLHFFAKGGRDLKGKLLGLGDGIGLATVNVFLRELRAVWDKAEPPLSEAALLAARRLGLTQVAGMNDLRILEEAVDERRISGIEAALARLGKNYCRRERCAACPMREVCQ